MGNDNSSGGESQQTGVIYKILCLVTGKPYVGKTKRNLKRRIIEHKRDSSRGRPGIDAAIAKYGGKIFLSKLSKSALSKSLTSAKFFGLKSSTANLRTATT